MGALKAQIKQILSLRLWAKLRLLRQYYTLRCYPRHSAQHIYGGVLLTVFLADPLAEGWYDRDWPELPEIALLAQRSLKPGARVFDLGAHQAVVALMLAHLIEPSGIVVAVEANSHNVAIANKNRELNQAGNLRIIHAAVAEASGSLVFNRGLDGQVDSGTGEWGRMVVNALTIDDLTRDYGAPDVIFIDIEGYESKALEGARESLVGRPDCFVEVHVGCGLEQFGGSVETVLSYFSPDDYELLIRAENDAEFVPLCAGSPILEDRFFLLALARWCSRPTAGGNH